MKKYYFTILLFIISNQFTIILAQWNLQYSYSNDSLNSVFFINQSTGWLASFYDYNSNYKEGRLKKTTDGGNNWITQYTCNDDIFNSVFFINQDTGWLASFYDYSSNYKKGKLRKTTNGGGVFIKKISSEIPNIYYLEQNFPNPFNPFTNIKYKIKNNSSVLIKVFDILGKEVATLVNEKQSPGTYSVEWDASQNPSGIYFCQMQTENFIDTKKMILIK